MMMVKFQNNADENDDYSDDNDDGLSIILSGVSK